MQKFTLTTLAISLLCMNALAQNQRMVPDNNNLGSSGDLNCENVRNPRCAALRNKELAEQRAVSQESGKAQDEAQVAALHARLRDAKRDFPNTRSNFDILGMRLGDSVSEVSSKLAKEFPKVDDKKRGIISASQCSPRSARAYKNGDCEGFELKPNGDNNAINPQTRKVAIYVSDKGRVHSIHYSQSNLFVAPNRDGCERVQSELLANLVSKFGKPFSQDKQTVTWGAALPNDAFNKAYNTNSYGIMGEKSLDGDRGLLNDAQKVLYFQGAYSLTAKCLGDKGVMSIESFLSDQRIEEQDSTSATSKPKL